jgi:hypothetical protein
MGFLTGERNDGETLPDEPPMVAMPGFDQPPPLRMDQPSEPSEHDGQGDGAGSDGLPLTETSAPSPIRPALDASAAAMWQGVGRGVIQGVGGLLNMWKGADESDEIWLPDKGETRQMGEPLGRIIGRRAPMPGNGDANPSDIADGIAIAIGLVGYGTRNLFEALRRRRSGNQKPPQDIPADAPHTYEPYGEMP